MKVLVLDDNAFVGMMIEKAVLDLGRSLEIFTVDNMDKARTVMAEHVIDVAFLDIEVNEHVPEDNGLVLASELVAKRPKTKIIFVSSYPRYALKAYDVHPFDFVVKPVDIGRLKQSAARVLEEIEREQSFHNDKALSQKGDKLFIRTNKEMLFLPFNEIFFIEKISKEVVIHTAKGEYNVRWTLAELENMLPKSFVRVHKSFLVNTGKISRISEFGDRTYEIFFDTVNKTAILSRYKVNDLFEVMNIPFKE